MDLVRLAYALRPEGLQWPEENGRAVFRLEALASANGISQPRAHDARDDVWATLGLARTLRPPSLSSLPTTLVFEISSGHGPCCRSPLRAFAFMCRGALIWLVGASP